MYESYSMPLIAPAYSEGPVRYHGDGVVASYPMDEKVYEECIPEPLEPTDQPMYQLLAVDYERTSGLGSYQELMVSVPALYDGDALAYSLFFLLTVQWLRQLGERYSSSRRPTVISRSASTTRSCSGCSPVARLTYCRSPWLPIGR